LRREDVPTAFLDLTLETFDRIMTVAAKTRERDSPMELQIGVGRLWRSLTVVKSLKRGLYRDEMLTLPTRGGQAGRSPPQLI
jgi:hypothetical protein